MANSGFPIRFSATLLRPANPKGVSWSFVVLPKAASAKLPTRSMTSIDGTVAGKAFSATLEPDGKGSHWLKLSRGLQQAAGIEAGDTVDFEMAPATVEPEPKLPADVRRALDAAPEARAQWDTLTPVARRDWIQWITSAKKAETRDRRIATGCDMLASGKRRACCFDRSGMFSKSLAAPEPAE